MEKTLLLTASSPNHVLNGTVVEQRKVARFCESRWLIWAVLGVSPNSNESSPLNQIDIRHLKIWGRPYRFFCTRIGDLLRDRLWSRVAAHHLVGLCRKEDIKRIWAVAEEFVPTLAIETARLTGLPLHVTIHDRPMRNCQISGEKSRWHWAFVERRCEMLFRAADSVDVVSRALQQYVESFASCPVRLYLPRARGTQAGRPQKARVGCGRRFRIGFNGNMHAGKEEVAVFLSWLRQLDCEYEFHIFGERAIPLDVMPFLSGCGLVIRHEYQPDYDAYLDRLAEMDAVYVGVWFAEDKDLMVRYSFPSKITAPLSVGVPLICHGPDYWDLTSWLDEIPFGVRINHVDCHTTPQALKDFVLNAGMRERYAESARQMFEKYLRLPDEPDYPWEKMEDRG